MLQKWSKIAPFYAVIFREISFGSHGHVKRQVKGGVSIPAKRVHNLLFLVWYCWKTKHEMIFEITEPLTKRIQNPHH